MKQGLTGHLRLAVIPTVLPVVSCLTSAFWTRHPGIKLTISSHTSTEVLSMIENLEVDAGLTYLDNEPLGRVSEVPLYRERHHLITAEGNPFSDRATVTWEEVATLPLCLLTPSMQNRRIIDRVFAEAGCRTEPLLETSSIVVIASHVRAGHWSTIMPRLMAEELAFPDNVKCIPIVAPEVANLVGLVVGHRDPQPPLTAALVAEARVLSAALSLRA
jgi:DNA-binding transcriptional LysR family regulator